MHRLRAQPTTAPAHKSAGRTCSPGRPASQPASTPRQASSLLLCYFPIHILIEVWKNTIYTYVSIYMSFADFCYLRSGRAPPTPEAQLYTSDLHRCTRCPDHCKSISVIAAGQS